MPAQNNDSQPNAWWTTLRHGGVLVSPIVLEERLPEGPSASSEYEVDRLRRAFTQFQRDPERELGAWLDTALETFLGHTTPNWQKGQNVADGFRHTEASGQIRKPSRVLLNALKEHEPRFLVLIDKDRLLKDDKTPGQIGVHGGRRTYGQFLALLRATNVKLGILTNGFQFRLIYAGLDTEAWTEWSASAWFEGGDGRRALDGFRSLLGIERIPPDTASSEHALLDMVEDSRKRQADLSHVMGTQVREAVEILLNSLDNTLASAAPQERDALLAPLRRLNLQRQSELDALYQAAIRVVMRLVVTAYAESRGLFPMEQGPYLQSYSLEMLFRRLQEAKVEEGIEVLHQQEGAWPTIVSQTRLVYHGSNTERLPNSPYGGLQMVAYGGRLFQPPADDTTDAVLAALSILESPNVRVSDATVHAMLELLKIGRFKSGRGKPLKGPVDFSDLRTEYIGMMYEGLLDYQLREARPEDGGIVFLNLGEQPALPLRLLTALSDERLADLIVELKRKTKGKDGGITDEEAEVPWARDETDSDNALRMLPSASGESDKPEESHVETSSLQERFEVDVMEWALRAVRVAPTAFLPPKARTEKDPTIRRKAEQAAAQRLVLRSIRPGGTYLVRWSGTRKGSGTFYTKPILSVPTVIRTLQPLVYDSPRDGVKIPRPPDEILALKVCDPAMGSGSFLVAALRFLTRALQESFEHHVFRHQDGPQAPVTVMGARAEGLYRERLLPLRNALSEYRGEGPDPNARMESELKRAVVEHCLYGVDLNPLAVELGKLSLWVETMDPQLTFAFLDHKVKCGNSLVGGWQVQAQHYPSGAWDRKTGDGKDDSRGKLLEKIRKQLIAPEMEEMLDQFDVEGGERRVRRARNVLPGQQTLGGEEAQSVPRRVEVGPARVVRGTRQVTMPTADSSAETVATWSRDVYRDLHETFDPKEQEEEYRKFLANPGYQRQKFLLDMWCAVWFWPVSPALSGDATFDSILSPKSYYAEREKPGSLPVQVRAQVQQLADELRFFHWEVEFPEVFETRRGFDAIAMNPPWEQWEPNEIELYTQFHPGFGLLDDQGRAAVKASLAGHPFVEAYYSQISLVGFFLRNAPAETPFPQVYQAVRPPTSGKVNLYKEFLSSLGALRSAMGASGIICPTGIMTDTTAGALRVFLRQRAGLFLIDVYQNRDRRYFDIPPQNKFAVCFAKGGARALEIWSEGQNVFTVPPDFNDSEGWPDFDSPKSAEIMRRIQAASTSFAGAGIEIGGELNTTTDRRNGNFIVLSPGDPIPTSLPVLQGTTINRFVGIAKSYEPSTDSWVPIDSVSEFKSSRYLNPDRSADGLYRRLKFGFKLTSKPQINPRSGICAVLPLCSTVHTIGVGSSSSGVSVLVGAAVVNSYVFDFCLRFLIPDQTISKTVIANLPFPKFTRAAEERIADIVYTLNCQQAMKGPVYPEELRESRRIVSGLREELEEELDQLVASAYGASDDDMRWILRPDNPDSRTLWRDYCERLQIIEGAGKRGRWYALEEARQLRRAAGMKVEF